MAGKVNLVSKKGTLDYYDYNLCRGTVWTDDDKGYDFDTLGAGSCTHLEPGMRVVITLNSKDEVLWLFKEKETNNE